MYVRDDLTYSRCTTLESPNLELLWIQLTTSTITVVYGVFYKPQQYVSEYWQGLEENIASLRLALLHNVFLLGDAAGG